MHPFQPYVDLLHCPDGLPQLQEELEDFSIHGHGLVGQDDVARPIGPVTKSEAPEDVHGVVVKLAHAEADVAGEGVAVPEGGRHERVLHDSRRKNNKW